MKKNPKPSIITKKNKNILKKVLLLLLSFIIQLGIYIGLLALGILYNTYFYTIGFTVYLTLGAVILVIYYSMNGATFSSVSPDVRRIDNEYADKLEISRAKAKKLHYILLPMAVLLLLVFADMYFGDSLSSLFR